MRPKCAGKAQGAAALYQGCIHTCSSDLTQLTQRYGGVIDISASPASWVQDWGVVLHTAGHVGSTLHA